MISSTRACSSASSACESASVFSGVMRQLGEAHGRADDLEPSPLCHSVDLARDRDWECELAATAVRADQAQEEEQRLLDGDLAALLVDQEEALAGAVEDGAEISCHGGDEPFRLADRLGQGRGARGGGVRDECVGADRLDAKWSQHQR